MNEKLAPRAQGSMHVKQKTYKPYALHVTKPNLQPAADPGVVPSNIVTEQQSAAVPLPKQSSESSLNTGPVKRRLFSQATVGKRARSADATVLVRGTASTSQRKVFQGQMLQIAVCQC